MTCSCSGGGAMLLRATILVGLASVVTTIIYLTPVPNPYYASCERPCHELAWPMICRYKLSVETYQAMGGACGQCPANATHCHALQCVSGDMTARGVMTANRMLPGPTLKVCENDIVVVDVVNRAMGQAMGVHWGGQSQREFPYMDGVPQLTQCPINTHTTFQYKFRAVGAGTHLWSATGSAQAAATVFGPLVVRQPDNRDPHRQLFDEDVHVLTVSALGRAVLVNGHSELQVAPLVRGRRYRLRLLHAGGAADGAAPGLPGVATGPVTLSVAGLPLLAIAVDGHPVRPRSTRALTLWPGERVDAVLSADQPPPSSAAFVLSVHAEDAKLADAVVTLPFTEQDKKRGVQAASTPAPDASAVSVADVLEGAELESVAAMPERLAKEEVDVRLYLPFDFVPGAGLRSDLSGPQPPNKAGKTRLPMGLPDTPWPRAVPRVCNISLSLPAAPLLTQRLDAESYDGEGGAAVCRGHGQPATCPSHLHGRADHSCECAHVIKVSLGSTVELVLADQGGDLDKAHVFQLHGYSFWLVGRGAAARTPSSVPLERGSWTALAAADMQGGLLRRHLHRAVLKDTVAVPALGAVALRFIADNPGYWLLREQSFYQWPSGLGVILQVGEESDLPPIPTDFPKCGSFVGPEFFLM